jgi:O-antigen ligase
MIRQLARHPAGSPARSPENSPVLRAGALVALVLWAPLPFGSVTGKAASALAAASFVVAALALLAEPSRVLARATRLALAALVAVSALGALQLVPLPVRLAASLSPGHARLVGETHRAFGVAATPPLALTLDRDATRGTLELWAMAAAVLLAAALHGGSRRARRALGAALCGAALFQVVYGVQQWLTGASTIWGTTVPYTPRLRGSFVNPNHLALLLEIAVAVAFAWLWWSVRRQLAAGSASAERRIASAAPAALVWLVLFAGLAFTGSRAGLLAALAATALQIALTSLGGRRWAAVGGAAALIVALGAVALSGPESGLGRLSRLFADGSSPARVEGAAAALSLWSEFPLFGCGLGSFRAGFPLVARRDLGGTLWHAHSDWLELAATGGALALLLVAAALGVVVRRLLVLWRKGERSEDRAAPLAALGALTAVALHELVDFGLTMPANAVVLAAVAGAALAVRPAGADAAQAARNESLARSAPA